MIITAHVVSGGVMGEMIGTPIIAFIVGIFFHFVLDLIPHWDSTDGEKWTKRQVVFTSLDIVLTLFIVFGVFGIRLTPAFFIGPFFWGAVGNMLPDIFDNVPYIKKWFRNTVFGKAFHKFHDGLHKMKPKPSLGIFTQIFVISLFIALYFI